MPVHVHVHACVCVCVCVCAHSFREPNTDKKSTTGKVGKEFGLQSNHLNMVFIRHHTIGVSTFNLFHLQMKERALGDA